eukprot:11736406-Alexandrium_andersonii.AAC.1
MARIANVAALDELYRSGDGTCEQSGGMTPNSADNCMMRCSAKLSCRAPLWTLGVGRLAPP